MSSQPSQKEALNNFCCTFSPASADKKVNWRKKGVCRKSLISAQVLQLWRWVVCDHLSRFEVRSKLFWLFFYPQITHIRENIPKSYGLDLNLHPLGTDCAQSFLMPCLGRHPLNSKSNYSFTGPIGISGTTAFKILTKLKEIISFLAEAGMKIFGFLRYSLLWKTVIELVGGTDNN